MKDSARIRLWDLPVRVVHWSFVLLMPALWWTWRSAELELHRKLGYLTLALVLFRLFWGIAGSSTARFTQFVKGPATVARYLSRRGEGRFIGHNPLGGWSVLLLLGLVFAELCLGLFTQDVDGVESGPLTPYISYETADDARGLHGLLFNILLAAIGLHIAAILFYLLFKRDNLVGPMLSGRKKMDAPEIEPRFVHPSRILACAVPAAAIAWWVSLGCPI